MTLITSRASCDAKNKIPWFEIEFLEGCHCFTPASFIVQAKTRTKYRAWGKMLSPRGKIEKLLLKSHTKSAWIFKGHIFEDVQKLELILSSWVLRLNLRINIWTTNMIPPFIQLFNKTAQNSTKLFWPFQVLERYPKWCPIFWSTEIVQSVFAVNLYSQSVHLCHILTISNFL